MKVHLLAAAAVLLSACASGYEPQEVEAVRDYVVAADLKEVDQVRLYRQMSYTYVNDHYVTVPTRRGDYLVEFAGNCSELRRRDFSPEMVDTRDNRNILRARFDTIRGCRIGRIFEISDEQRKELRDLGDAPGDEVFIPEKDDEDN